MSALYSSMMLITLLSIVTLSILIFQNDRLTKKEKMLIHMSHVVIVFAAVSEWAALALNGTPAWTVPLHKVCKCMDYIMSPLAGIMIIRQLSTQSRFRRTTGIIIGINTVFEIISIFTGWAFYVDDQNYYHHGPLNFVYMIVYTFVIVMVVVEFVNYGKQFKRQNRTSIYAIASLVLISVFLQEVIDSEMRVIYLALTTSAALMFIHYSEFSQQRRDEDMSLQQRLLETDPLTGMFSRYAYTQALAEINEKQTSLEPITVFSIDINGLKKINDSLGHLAGDELICGAAKCINQVLNPFGKCYRTGGDEFIAFVTLPKGDAEAVKQRMLAAAAAWKGEQIREISLSVGYVAAADFPGANAEKLIYEADQQMYVEKNAYYQRVGGRRRG